MKKTLGAATLAACSLGVAWPAVAQQGAPSSVSAASASAPIRFFAGGGLTYGGDRLADVPFRRGEEDRVRAGGLVAGRLGLDVRLTDLVSLQVAGGYHVHSTRFRHGDAARFSRYPLELIAHFNLDERMRIGAGVRRSIDPKLVGRDVTETHFRDATGGVIDLEYFVTPKVGVSVRGVLEDFKVEGSDTKINGNHLGVFGHYYF